MEYLRDTIYNAVSLTFGKKHATTADWFKAQLDKRQPFMDEKRRGFVSYKARLARGHSRYLGRPETKSNRFQGVVLKFGFNCAITYRSVLTKAI